MQPRITIIVPTRERCDTLQWALKTCVTQDYDNLEILVSDNASTDDTDTVVRSFQDPRIRYINPGRRLGMSEHWEFALSHVSGDHVGIIGDDDGLLPSAVEEISDIVGHDQLPLVWPIQQYFWPSYPDPALANSLLMPLRQPADVRQVSSEETVHAVLQNFGLYPLLPSPYFGVVPSTAFSAMRRQSGSVFHSITPDIFAGFAVAAVCPAYLRTERAYSLAGQSQYSNGASQLSGRGNNDANSPTAKYYSENTILFHRELSVAPSIPIIVAEAALQARDSLGLDVPLDVRHMISAALRDPQYVFNPPVRGRVDAALAEIAVKHGMTEDLRRETGHLRAKLRCRFLKEVALSVFFRHPLITCDPETVTNVYEASLFVKEARPRFARGYVGCLRRLAARMSKVRRSLHGLFIRVRRAH